MLLEGNKMTITAYYPIYMRRDIEAALKQYTEELGFELLHTVEDGVVKAYVLGLGSYSVRIAWISSSVFLLNFTSVLAISSCFCCVSSR